VTEVTGYRPDSCEPIPLGCRCGHHTECRPLRASPGATLEYGSAPGDGAARGKKLPEHDAARGR
jgi:hypothetical protein